jgi:arabinogalactan endo-1,4-beta-galactosidase
VKDAPEGHGLGVVYWHPESVPMHNAGPQWNGGDTALFDGAGNALMSIDGAGQLIQHGQ